MDNPLAGSSDSEDSDGSGGMFDFTDSEDASSDDGGEPEPVVDDDFMANLMPTSRLDGDGGDDDDDSSSEDEGPMTAEQIRALRAGAATSGAQEEEEAKRDFAEELKGSDRVPMMFGTSAAGSVRIDWARIEKADMQLFVEKFAADANAGAQATSEGAKTGAWPLQHSVRSCVGLMLQVAEADGAAESLVSTLKRLAEQVKDAPLGEDHLCTRKADRASVQPAFDQMTDAVQDVCAELRGRLEGATLGPPSAENMTSVERVEELVEGLQDWLDAGADPSDDSAWAGLQLRLTWVPALQMRGKSLYVESMELKKRRKKHISCDAVHHRSMHYRKQVASQSHETRGWLLQHALATHLDKLGEILAANPRTGSEAVTKSVGELRRAVDQDTALRLVKAEGGGDYSSDLVDAVQDVVSELTARSGRLATHAPLGAEDSQRVQHLVEEVRQWLDGGVDAAKSAQSSRQAAPWRTGHGTDAARHSRLSQRWDAVFASGARVWRLLDVFDADDDATLKKLVHCGMPLDMALDEGGESLLMAAAQRNASACAEWLLEEGADCNAANDDGSTAYHYACAFGSLHCIASLLKHSCDVDAKDDEGKTGADLAESEPWRDILNMMLTLGFNEQWKELEVLIDDQTRVRSLEDLVEAEADKRRPNLEYQSLPPSRWMEHHVISWLEDTFAWSSHYLDKLKSMGLTGELLVTSDDNVLKTTYDIEEKAHRDELVTALKDQDLWGWE